jgi:hypothetical protein
VLPNLLYSQFKTRDPIAYNQPFRPLGIQKLVLCHLQEVSSVWEEKRKPRQGLSIPVFVSICNTSLLFINLYYATASSSKPRWPTRQSLLVKQRNPVQTATWKHVYLTARPISQTHVFIRHVIPVTHWRTYHAWAYHNKDSLKKILQCEWMEAVQYNKTQSNGTLISCPQKYSGTESAAPSGIIIGVERWGPTLPNYSTYTVPSKCVNYDSTHLTCNYIHLLQTHQLLSLQQEYSMALWC